jgi:hypothetical protein
MHQATCYVKADCYQAIDDLLTVYCRNDDRPTVALATVHGLQKCHHPNPVRARRELTVLMEILAEACSRTELLRGLLDYLSEQHLTPAVKQFASKILRRRVMA